MRPGFHQSVWLKLELVIEMDMSCELPMSAHRHTVQESENRLT